MCQLKAVKVLIALTSSLAIAGGFVIMGWTFYMIISTQWLSSGIPSQLTNIAQITAAVAISIGGLGVLFGIAGFCTLKFRHALLVASYGILGFLLTAIYALAAIVLVYLYVVKTDQVDLFCKGNLKAGIGKLQPYVNNLYNQTKVWDSTFNSSVSSFMCKSTCPCVPVNQSLWNATTKQQFSLPKATGGVYNFTGNYTKFSDCYSDQKKVIDGGSNKTALISLTRLSQISFFEQQLDCSGMCQAPLFWTTKNVTLGPPPARCAYKIKEVYNQKIGPIGFAICGTGFVIFLSWLLHFCYFCPKNRQVGNQLNGRTRKFNYD